MQNGCIRIGLNRKEKNKELIRRNKTNNIKEIQERTQTLEKEQCRKKGDYGDGGRKINISRRGVKIDLIWK